MGINVTEELLEKIDNYLKGLLSAEDSVEFEKKIQSDSQLKEIVIIQQGLFTINNNENSKKISKNNYSASIKHYKEQINDDENQKLLSIIKKAGENYNNKNKVSKKSLLKYSVAASIAILFSTFFYINSNNNLKNYYEANINWDELPSYTSKGNDSIINFTKGEKLFRDKKFEKAISTFNLIPTSNKLYPYSLLYIGASYEQLNQNEKALEIFEKVSKLQNFEEYSKGYWYQLLIFLKLDNKESAIKMRSLILKDSSNFNYEKVKSFEF
jgi:hypothetical protein